MTVQDLIQRLLDGIKAGTLKPDTPVLVPCVWTSLLEDPRFTYRDLTDAEFAALNDPYKYAELDCPGETRVALDKVYWVTGGRVYRTTHADDPDGVRAAVLY